MTMDEAKTILVGVTGGIAAYKVLEVVSSLRKAGHVVRVAMTPSAQKFVAPLSFAGVSGQAVLTASFPEVGSGTMEDWYPHLYPATEADLFLLAPATANGIGQVANGLGRDVVSTSALSLRADCARVFCPAMNVEMWEQATVRTNVARLEDLGWHRVGPTAGHLACGMAGQGRLAEPSEILAAVESQLGTALTGKDLAGKRVLVLSGPTREHFDPVRYIGNPSSGKMGREIALAALARGASVEFVSGPVSAANLPGARNGASNRLSIEKVVSAEEMLGAARERFASADIVVYVAAVADYRPVERSETKGAKKSGRLTMELEATPDIAATLCAEKQPGQICIGFALQTDNGEARAREKLARKSLDGIVLNYVDTLGADDGAFTFIPAHGSLAEWGRLDKETCAGRILDEAAGMAGRWV